MLKHLRNYNTFGEFHWSQAQKAKELQHFWRIPLASQPASQPQPASQAATASQAASHSRPASHSQPASQRPKSALDHIQHQIAPRGTKSTTFAHAFFQAFNSRKQPASQPAGLPASQPIQYFAGRGQPLSTKMLLKFNIFMNCKSLSGSSAGIM